MDQAERDVDALIQALLNEASLGQWDAVLDAEKAVNLRVRLKDCADQASAAGFQLGELQLRWAIDVIEKRLNAEGPPVA